MKRHLAPALFSLSLCAVLGGVRTAGAQSAGDAAPVVADSTAAPAHVTDPQPVTVVRRDAHAAGAPTIMTPTPFTIGESQRDAERAAALPSAVMVDWKMPTSRALMIGGAVTAIVGVAVVGGDTGAIIALSGTAVAVYGLYLHYNR